jgi:hypothetical protein
MSDPYRKRYEYWTANELLQDDIARSKESPRIHGRAIDVQGFMTQEIRGNLEVVGYALVQNSLSRLGHFVKCPERPNARDQKADIGLLVISMPSMPLHGVLESWCRPFDGC